jgi:glc operon protein GlcG
MLTLDMSQKILSNVLAIATQDGLNVAVAVVDTHGELMCYARMDKASLQAGILAQNKAYTSAREQQPTSSLGLWAQATQKDMGYWTDNKFTGLGGGIPLNVNGQHIGAVGVSGLSEQQDELLARKAVADLI